ncbi:hypothetical protein GGR66_003769 [Xanthomonas sp. 3498]|nr:hypothetical protein [Xanthomonas sp. 3498]
MGSAAQVCVAGDIQCLAPDGVNWSAAYLQQAARCWWWARRRWSIRLPLRAGCPKACLPIVAVNLGRPRGDDLPSLKVEQPCAQALAFLLPAAARVPNPGTN